MEQGNPGIYIQVDEWLGIYRGNVFVVDEVTGRIYVMKGAHLEHIPKVASRCRREDRELSVSRHIPEWETGERTPQQGVGRTPVPVAESTREPQMERTPMSQVTPIAGDHTLITNPRPLHFQEPPLHTLRTDEAGVREHSVVTDQGPPHAQAATSNRTQTEEKARQGSVGAPGTSGDDTEDEEKELQCEQRIHCECDICVAVVIRDRVLAL